MTHQPPVTRVARRSSATLAATLSFLLPGLGQAYAGQPWLGLLFAAPLLLAAGLAIGAAVAGADSVLRTLLLPGALVAVLAGNLAFMVWRLIAIGHAGLAKPPALAVGDTGRSRRSPLTVAVVAVLMVATVAMHLWVATTTVAAEEALARIFAPQPGSDYVPPNYGHLDPDVPDYRWDGTERLNFLLLGYDSGPGRSDENTDTIMVVSVDPVAKTAFMVSIPRDTGNVPLPDRQVYGDGIYPLRINGLAQAANEDPDLWCPELQTGQDCGLSVLRQAVGLYVGLPIHYVAWVDLEGFAAMVDAMGGIQLCLPGVLADPEYGGPTWQGRGVVLEAGCQTYDGAHALAFARIRKGTMTMPDGSVVNQNDFLRADRQQQFLLAVQQKVAETNLLISLPGLLTAVGETVTTDFPRNQAGDLASLAPLVATGNIERVVLGWPGYVDLPVDPLNYYLLIPRRDAIRAEMARIAGGTDQLSGWYLTTTAAGP